MKNAVRYCKIEVGRVRNSSLDTKLGPILALSWLVGGQLAAKMSKLTLLGGQKGTKLELRGALRVPKEAPRAPKRVWLTLSMLRRV